MKDPKKWLFIVPVLCGMLVYFMVKGKSRLTFPGLESVKAPYA